MTNSPPRESILPSSQPPRNAGTSNADPVDGTEKKSEGALARISAALAEINQSLKSASVGLQFEFNDEAGKIIARVVDVGSGEMVREMSSEEAVRVSRVLGKLQGLLVHQEICDKAQLKAASRIPASVRWSRSWAAVVASQAPAASAR